MIILEANVKYFFVTRGIPGSGKSSFVEKYLSDIATIVSPDNIRLKLNGIVETKDHGLQISQKNSDEVWKEVFSELTFSLSKNRLTVLDATSLNNIQLERYLKLAEEYDAKLVIIDFSSISLDECKWRNSLRQPEYKRVPEVVIDGMYIKLQKPLSTKIKECLINYIAFADQINVLK